MTIDITFETMPFNEVVTQYLLDRLNSIAKRHEWLEKAIITFRRTPLETKSLEICEITVETSEEDYRIVATGEKITSATKEALLDMEQLIKNWEGKFAA